jgi:hypothetical protein
VGHRRRSRIRSLALDQSPVVIQVPDFGDRFWVYQIVDLRTDSFVQFGKMYGTTPGFYLLVGPNWKGEAPKGITKVFRCPTKTGIAAPRVFQDDNAEDKKAIQAVLAQVRGTRFRRARRDRRLRPGRRFTSVRGRAVSRGHPGGRGPEPRAPGGHPPPEAGLPQAFAVTHDQLGGHLPHREADYFATARVGLCGVKGRTWTRLQAMRRREGLANRIHHQHWRRP